jgi:hypothetical protein
MYSIICAVAPEYQLTMARVEDLRTAVREFLQDRFSSFYQAGGCFRDRDDIAFESQGKPALTLAGADKFRRVLEGRLNSKFVNACMKAGITNPFDFDLPPATVQRLGGFRSMPQPANPDLRLLNPRAVPADGTTARIRATLVWTTPGGELFRNDLEFTGIDQLVQLVRTIDCWTTESLASGHPQPPTHTGIEFLRRLCDGHHYGYRPDFP